MRSYRATGARSMGVLVTLCRNCRERLSECWIVRQRTRVGSSPRSSTAAPVVTRSRVIFRRTSVFNFF
jgi:hypothetical protein